jgi:hypothetical protein
VLPFSVSLGQTQILINSPLGATFQTGTTSGRIVFTLTGVVQGINGDPTTVLTIVPSRISTDTSSAKRVATELDVAITGFDNTFTAGVMTFTFRDAAGLVIGSGGIRADFTSDFTAYFTRTKAGSAFQALIAFPVAGDDTVVATVDVDLVNAAGTTTQHLIFH